MPWFPPPGRPSHVNVPGVVFFFAFTSKGSLSRTSSSLFLIRLVHVSSSRPVVLQEFTPLQFFLVILACPTLKMNVPHKTAGAIELMHLFILNLIEFSLALS
jgi:hypothetical protein